ncbi:MAG: glycosyltransferase [Candidatus Cloacimonetes bacterium]|nr:glycosyltransferase [Candidatus Cloacimonadota bacterium]
MTSFCVLIPYFNKEDSIKEVLQALNDYCPSLCKVLLLIDGCLAPNLPTYNNLDLTLISNETNQGLSFSRNKLLETCTDDNILFLDADAVIYPDFFEALNKSWNQAKVIAGQEFSSPNQGLSNAFRSIFWKQTHGNQNIIDCPFLMGICFAGQRKEFLKYGEFSLNWTNYGEDVEFSLRYKKHSPIFYNSGLKVHHLRNDSVKSMMQMINNHNKFFIKAHLFHKIKIPNYFTYSFYWILVSVYSSLFTHKSPSLAFASFIYNGFSALNRCYHFINYRFFNYDKH